MSPDLKRVRRAGVALIAIGTVDIAIFAYCIANSIGYSSSFNIFAVIAGTFLVRLHPRAIGLVWWFSGFMFVGFLAAAVLLLPWIPPIEYTAFKFQQSPVSSLATATVGIGMLAFLGWLHRLLSADEVQRFARAYSRPPPNIKLGYGAGVGIVVLMVVVMNLTLRGTAADHAINLAKQEAAESYKYFVSSLRLSNGKRSATVVAYGPQGERTISVQWQE